MFIIFLRLSDQKSDAPKYMDGHNAWLKSGFDDGVFLLAGRLQPSAGGAILAQGVTRDVLETRLQLDPFVANNVARPEIFEILPVRADERLGFLLDKAG